MVSGCQVSLVLSHLLLLVVLVVSIAGVLLQARVGPLDLHLDVVECFFFLEMEVSMLEVLKL